MTTITETRPATASTARPSSVGQPESGDRDADARSVVALARQLADRYPDVPVAEIERLITWCLHDTAEAKVQGFRLILAERAVRNHLRRSGLRPVLDRADQTRRATPTQR
jgi:hypothetical protein